MTDQTPNTAPKTDAPKKTRNWTRLALLASLAINLLIVAALAGAFFKHEKPNGRHLDRMSFGLGSYIQALPEAAQSEVMTLVNKGSKDRRAFRRDMRERRIALDAALQTEPFSADAVRGAMENMRGMSLGKTVRIQDAYLDAVTKMTEAERSAHFQRAKELMDQKRRKKRKKSDD